MESLAALRSLVAAVQEGSLSAAARRLGITQPAVSQQIAALEQSYGIELVVRGRNGVRPTEAGQLATDHAAEVLARLARMGDDLAALQASGEGRLVISCAMLVAQTVIVPVLSDLRGLHPGLRIDLRPSDAVESLAENGADLAIRAGSAGTGDGTVRKLAEIELLLVASRKYLDRVGRPAGPDDLLRLDYIQYKDDPEETSVQLEGGAIAPVRAAFAAQLPNLIRHAVTSHLGFAKAPRFFVQDLLDTGEIEELLPIRPVGKPLFVVRAPGTSGASRRVALFLDRFVAELARTPGFRLAADLRPARSDGATEA
jgi:DNA-binding transcriptional LysR family regulator